jgi:flagellar hook-length control protein FliK
VPAAAAAAPAAGGTSADTGSTSDQGATGSQPTTTATSPVTAPATITTAAVSDVDGATGAAATQPVGSQVARQVAVLRGGPDGTQTMTLVLTPDTIGPVEVEVTLTKGTVDLTLRGAHEHGRAALLDALPDLRRDLETAGLNPSRLEVDRDAGGSWLARHAVDQQAQQQAQSGFGDRGSSDRGAPRSRPWGAAADTAVDGSVPNPNRSTSSGVDYRV